MITKSVAQATVEDAVDEPVLLGGMDAAHVYEVVADVYQVEADVYQVEADVEIMTFDVEEGELHAEDVNFETFALQHGETTRVKNSAVQYAESAVDLQIAPVQAKEQY